MKGKKIDTVFLSNFIASCIANNQMTPEEIVASAKTQIENIDDKIKEVEKLKVVRSKLLDVIDIFDKPIPSHKSEAHLLPLFKIQNPDICRFICLCVQKQNIVLDKLYKQTTYQMSDVIFCVKQLIEHQIITKVGECLMQGNMFHEYMKFVLRGE